MSTIDLSRLEAIRAIARRERAAHDAAAAHLSELNEAASQLRSQMLAHQRKAGELRRVPSNDVLLLLHGQRKEVDAKIADATLTVEIARDRSRAASVLRSSCEKFSGANL